MGVQPTTQESKGAISWVNIGAGVVQLNSWVGLLEGILQGQDWAYKEQTWRKVTLKSWLNNDVQDVHCCRLPLARWSTLCFFGCLVCYDCLTAWLTLNLFAVSRPASNVTCPLTDRPQARERKIRGAPLGGCWAKPQVKISRGPNLS